ncbi:MAG TPA: Ppx/GppA phosphatase family protein [Candidatus Binataceae bacterium]|nr:Ppx/GppA phosphatase family protein [Candidatus Binataceae bacterium]
MATKKTMASTFVPATAPEHERALTTNLVPRPPARNWTLMPLRAPLNGGSLPQAKAARANGMTIAAIDIGSNSIHMVTARVRHGDFEILDRAKEMVGLARGTLTSGRLSPETMEFGLKTLATFKRLAQRQGADPILAVATSAVREAVNGGEFMLEAWEKFGLHIDVITGAQEARLIFAAARHAIDFRGQRPLVIDIGGGSIEIVQGEGNKVRWQESLKLGVVRLTERFFKSDPPKAGEIAAFKSYVRQTLEPVFARARRTRPTMLVGTSGTLLTLTAMAAALRDGQPPHKLHNYILERKALAALTEKILESRARERAHIVGLERRRVDIIPAGALLAGILLDGLRCEEMRACELALREGILLDFIDHHHKDVRAAEHVPSIRQRSVLSMASRFQAEPGHGQQVARLALGLFDATRSIHKLGAAARELLEYAALLHDVGLYVSHSGHHRHSHYLITQGELRGFDSQELCIIAAVARFHKGAPPKTSSPELAELEPENRKLAIALTAFLRVADGLDRTHHGVVRGLRLSRNNGKLELCVDCAGRDAELELWAAQRKSELLEKCFGRPLYFRAKASN